MSEVEVEEHTSRASLEPHIESWRALWETARDATVFQRPEWIIPWVEHVLSGSLRALCMWRAGRLVGLVPFFEWSDRAGRVLSLSGAGVSDYQATLCAEGCEASVARALVGWLEARRGEWQRFEWSELCPEGLLTSLPLSGEGRLEAQESCPAIPLPARVDALPEVVSKRLWSNTQKAQRSLARKVTLRFEHATEDTFEACFDELMRLHAFRREACAQPDLFARRAHRAFLQQALRGLSARGACALAMLRADEIPVSMVCTLHDRRTTRFYMAGFDPAWSKASVGSIVLAHELERAVQRGDSWLDFLRGAEPYKYQWGARDRVTLMRRILHPLAVAQSPH